MLTKIEWPSESQCHTKPRGSRRKDAVSLGKILDPFRKCESCGEDLPYQPPTRRKRADLGTLNSWSTFKQWFTFSETYPHGIPGFYSVSVVLH
jgi:hypothetical protein